MNPLLEKLPEQYKKLLKKKSMPSFEKPMLATLTDDYFSDKNWIYEHKLDGVRCLLFKSGHTLFVKSRNNTRMSTTYPEIITAAKELAVDQIIVDGEIVSSSRGTASSFSVLQARIGIKNPIPELIKKIKIQFYVFDIIYLDGYDLTRLPLLIRKNILKQIRVLKLPLRYLAHKREKGQAYFKYACHKGWEGVIAKDINSIYEHARSRRWLKFKCVQEQELVICGYTDPEGSRIGFGALLVGYYQGKKLYYAGKVGTGYSDAFLREFSKKLRALEIAHHRFANPEVVAVANAHFVKPYYVGEFGFAEWTRDNKLRHGRFLGLRDDKKAQDVVRERPE